VTHFRVVDISTIRFQYVGTYIQFSLTGFFRYTHRQLNSFFSSEIFHTSTILPPVDFRAISSRLGVGSLHTVSPL
jgi:hypothetical protein